MRKHVKKEVLELIGSLFEAHQEIGKAIDKKQTDTVQNMLAECQEYAIHLGGIIEQMEYLEYGTGMKVTGFVNNTNLVRETTAECLAYGDEILKEVTKRTGVPVKYVAYVKDVMTEAVPEGLSGELFPMEFNMRKTWM